MNPIALINRILSGDKPDPSHANVPKATPTADFIKQVWEAPALYNRATRRRVGLRSHLWRWDTNAVSEMQRTFVPRFIRRHFSTTIMLTPRTRRERRARAKIVRLAKAHGINQ